jgi:hypothetical protein
MSLIFGHPAIDFGYRHTRNGLRFNFLHRAGEGGAGAAEILAVRESLRRGLARIGAS